MHPTAPPPARAARVLPPTELVGRMAQHPDWTLDGDGASVAIRRTVRFADFRRAMAFANAVAYACDRLAHPPELGIDAAGCTVRFRTPAAGGITAADFSAAAQVDRLLAEPA